ILWQHASPQPVSRSCFQRPLPARSHPATNLEAARRHVTAAPPPTGKDELDTGRIRWLIRARMERFTACVQSPRFDARGQRDGSLVQWFATFFPLLFT